MDTKLASVLRSARDSAQHTCPSTLPEFRNEHPLSPAVPPIDAQVHRTRVRAPEQGALTIDPAAALHSEHHGAQDTPPTSLPVIRNERPSSPTLAAIAAQIHTTSVKATERAAPRTDQPPTTLPAPTGPAAPETPLAPRASSTSSSSSAQNNTPSLSP